MNKKMQIDETRESPAPMNHDHVPRHEACDELDPQRKKETGCEIARLVCKPQNFPPFW